MKTTVNHQKQTVSFDPVPTSEIAGLTFIPQKKIVDSRGAIIKLPGVDNEHYFQPKEIYHAFTNPGVIKGWHIHHKFDQYLSAINGLFKIVFYDARKDSPTYKEIQELLWGDSHTYMILIPHNVCYAYQCISKHAAIVHCLCKELRDESESEVFTINSEKGKLINHRW